MKRLLRYGRFGAFYGSLSVGVAQYLFAIFLIVGTQYSHPSNDSVERIIGGLLTISLSFFIRGYIVGLIGGFVFGLIASTINNRIGWVASGLVGGFVASGLFMWNMYSSAYYPVDINLRFLSICSIPWIALTLTGYFVGLVIHRGHPKIPRLYWIYD